ncbi:MAG: citrate lyase beta subunit [Cyanobacteria bacterium SIG32]|nr:citrate lyase beta subunit [Cyanobacteria bacterium SIG32]
MKNFESKILDILTDLKKKHGVVALKAEFEAEGASFDEVLLLKQYASEVGLNLTLKIGGCEAIRDIIDAKTIGVDTIVAPMIESAYALKKFVSAVEMVYSNNTLPKLFINIETITSVNNFAEILYSDSFKSIDGIVLGRTDLLGSMELISNDIKENQLFDIANSISEKVYAKGKKMVIGGSISFNSLEFLKGISYLSGFETRKVVFSADTLNCIDLSYGINKALEFEILWLENKIAQQSQTDNLYIQRLNVLRSRYAKCFEIV